jgi:uncharacterized protein YndB with AHSA1/START domain
MRNEILFEQLYENPVIQIWEYFVQPALITDWLTGNGDERIGQLLRCNDNQLAKIPD